MAKQFNPFHSWLGIEERLGVPTHFQLLGVKPKVDDQAAFQLQVENNYNAVVAKLNGMSAEEIGSHQKMHTRVKAHVAKARQILLDEKLRTAYIQGLRDRVLEKNASTKTAAGRQKVASVKNATAETRKVTKPAIRQTAATIKQVPPTEKSKQPASEQTRPETIASTKPPVRETVPTIMQVPPTEKSKQPASERTRPETIASTKPPVRETVPTIMQVPPTGKTKQPVSERSATETIPMATPVATPIARPVAAKTVTPVAGSIAQSARVEVETRPAPKVNLPEPPPTLSEFYRGGKTVAPPNDVALNAEIDKLEQEARVEAIRVRTVRKRKKRSLMVPILIGSLVLLGMTGYHMLSSSTGHKLDLNGLAGSSDSASTEDASTEDLLAAEKVPDAIVSDNSHTLETGLAAGSEPNNDNSTMTEGGVAAEPKAREVAPEIAPEAWPPAEIDTPAETAMVPDNKTDTDMGSSTTLPKSNETDVAMNSEPITMEPIVMEPIVMEPSVDEPAKSEPIVLDSDPAPDMEIASNEPTTPTPSFFDRKRAAEEKASTGEAPVEEAKDPGFFANKVSKLESAKFLISRARAEMKRGRTDSAAEQFILAQTILDAAKGKVDPTTEQQIADGRKVLAEIDGFWNHVSKSARSYSGDSLQPAPGVKIGLVESREDDVVLKISGELVPIPYRSLRPGLAMELASKTEASDAAQWLRQQAAFRIIHSSGSSKSAQAIEYLLTEGDAVGLSTEPLRRFWKSGANEDDVAVDQKPKYLPKELKPLVGQLVAGKYSSIRRVDPETAGSLATELSSVEYSDPMMRVAALDESIRLATRAGRASLMVDLIDELGNSVQIDKTKMKLEGFQEMTRRVPKGADPREIAGTFYEFTRSSDADSANSFQLQKLKITMLEFAVQNELIDLKRLISQSLE